MIGVDRHGLKAERSKVSRWSMRQISLDELTGCGPKNDRNAAILVLARDHNWSNDRLSILFGITERMVRMIIRDFRLRYEGEVS